MTIEKLHIIKDRASTLGLKVMGLIGSVKHDSRTYTMGDYETIRLAICEHELFEKERSEFVIHTNLKEHMYGENIDRIELHMLWVFSEL